MSGCGQAGSSGEQPANGNTHVHWEGSTTRSRTAHARTRGRKHDPSKTRTCVEFDDDGPGIPESKWLEVLEPFVRLSETGQSRSLPGQLDRSSNQSTPINYAGIGLGLAIVNRILKQHNGSLEITQSPLGGCSVRTFWPCPKDRIV
jgi:signal transduction histidine kinase